MCSSFQPNLFWITQILVYFKVKYCPFDFYQSDQVQPDMKNDNKSNRGYQLHSALILGHMYTKRMLNSSQSPGFFITLSTSN